MHINLYAFKKSCEKYICILLNTTNLIICVIKFIKCVQKTIRAKILNNFLFHY